MDITQRLELFFRRLAEAPPAATAEEALRLVCRLIEEVEDECCPVPRETPAPIKPSGRMYPPQADNIFPLENGDIEAQTRRHSILCLRDGGIVAKHALKGETVLTKPGKPR